MDSAALEEQGIQERAVVLLAPTGGGKTTLARELKKRLGRAVIVSAHESWRESYFAVLSSILQALGERVPHNARKAEAALLAHLTESKVTLIFDEQDFFGRSALNLIRQILNETRAAVVMHMLPQTWDRIVRDGGEYAAQFCRRCCVVTKAPALTDKEALPFLRESLPDAPEADLREAAKVLAREANIFGSISLLSSVAESLSRLKPEAGQSLAQLAATVAKYYQTRRQLSHNIAAA
jgi:MoxR-like ATPase